jgi:hypothetical protein
VFVCSRQVRHNADGDEEELDLSELYEAAENFTRQLTTTSGQHGM